MRRFVGTFGILSVAYVERIRSLMISGNNRSLSSVQKAITFYQSCVDTDAVEKLNQLITNLVELWYFLSLYA